MRTMAKASFHRIRDWIDLNEVMSRLLVLHGGAHAFAAHHLEKVLIAGGVGSKVRYFDQSASYPRIEREQVLWAEFWLTDGRIRWRAEIGTRGDVVTDDPSDHPPDYRWQAVVISTLDLGGYAHQVLLNRRDCDQHLFADEDDPSTTPAPEPAPLEPKKWLFDAADRLKKVSDRPKRITDAARRLQLEMAAAAKADKCTRALSKGRIENLLREHKLWP